MPTNDQGRDEFVIERAELGTVFRSAIPPESYGVYFFGSNDKVRWFHTFDAAWNYLHPAPSQDAPAEIRHSRYEETELEKLKRKP